MNISSIEKIIERQGDEWLLRNLEICCPLDGEVFISRLYLELSSIIRDIEQSAQYRQNDSEDRITVDIVHMLHRAGYDASHDTDSRGHIDLRVKSGTFIWLGEAKIHRD